jgi:acylaminoacyl-peptidase
MRLKADDILKFEAIGEPQWSPVDDSFIFMRKVTQDGKVKTAIFKSLNDKEVQLTEYELSASSPRFSPCGKFISYIAKKDDKSCLFIMNEDGSDIKHLEHDKSVSGPISWSPKGDSLLFRSAISLSGNDRPDYNGKPHDHDYLDDLKIKVMTSIRYRFDGIGNFYDKRNQVFIVGFNDGDFSEVTQVSNTELDISNPIFNYDGTRIYFTSNPDERALETVKSNIYSLDLNGDIRLCVTGEGYLFNLQVSKCGKYLSFVGLDYSDMKEMDKFFDTLYVYEIGDETHVHKTRNVSSVLNRMVCVCPSSAERYFSSTSMYKWTEDSKGFYLIYGNEGSSSLVLLNLDGSYEIVWEDKMKSISAFSEKSERFILQVGSMEHTENLYLFDDEEILLVESNSWLKDYDLGKGHRFTFLGDEAHKVDGWYLSPANYENCKDNKAVLFIHGGPHGVYGSSFMFQTQLLASNGYFVYYINPRGSSTYGFEFASKVYKDWGSGDFRDLMSGTDFLISKGLIDKDKLGITGWSYGGYMTTWAVSQTDRFKAAVAGASITNRYSMFGTSDIGFTYGYYQFGGTPWENAHKLIERSPLNYADEINTPLLFIHGENDLRCPVAQSEELFAALKFQNKETVLITYPNESHGFKQPYHLLDRYARTKAWFDYYLR